MEQIDILLVTFDHLKDIKSVVSLVYKNTASPFRLLVADNGRKPEIVEWLNELALEKKNVIILENPDNKFCCLASNQLLSLVSSKYAFYLCSYETFVLRYGWDLECLDAMEKNPQAGIGGHLSWSKYYITGQDYINQKFFENFRNTWYAEQHRERKFFHIQGGFYIIRVDMVRQIGGFNEGLVHSHMDVEYSYYIESCGWKLLELPQVLSIHRTTRPNLEAFDLIKYSVVHPLSTELCRKYLPEVAAALT